MMNNAILMGKIISQPQLRYVKGFEGEENIAVTTIFLEFESLDPQQPAMNLKIVAWRNIAEEINSKYRIGDLAVVQGRLQMNTIEVNGIKQKKAELIVSHLYQLGKNEVERQPLDLTTPMTNSHEVSEFENDPRHQSTQTESSVSANQEKALNSPGNQLCTVEEELDNLPY